MTISKPFLTFFLLLSSLIFIQSNPTTDSLTKTAANPTANPTTITAEKTDKKTVEKSVTGTKGEQNEKNKIKGVTLSQKPKCYKENLLTLAKVTVTTPRDAVMENMKCHDKACKPDDVKFLVMNDNNQIYPIVSTKRAGVVIKNGAQLVSNNSWTFDLHINTTKLRFSKTNQIIFYFTDMSDSCNINIKHWEQRLINKIDPGDCGNHCEGRDQYMLYVHDFSKGNCKSGFKGKLRIMGNYEFELRGFEALQMNGINGVNFFAVIVDGGIEPLYTKACKIQDFNEFEMMGKPQTFRLLSRHPYKLNYIKGILITSKDGETSYLEDNLICSEKLRPITDKDISEFKVDTGNDCQT